MKSLKITGENLVVYMLFFALFKPYFLPTILQQSLKILAIFIVMIYVVNKASVKSLFNYTLIIVISIILSCFINYWTESYITFREFLNGTLFALCIYCLFALFNQFGKKGKSKELLKSLLKINFIYCGLALIFFNFPCGTESGDSNLIIYIFGNKFVNCYLFLQLLTIYYSYCWIQNSFRRINKIVFIGLFIITEVIAIGFNCSTVVIVSLIPMAIFLFPPKLKEKLYNVWTILITIIGASVFPFFINGLLSNAYVQYFITSVLHRSLTLSGRTHIYTKFLIPVIGKKLFFGYGYSNDAMKSASIYYTNAQNGLLDWIINYGIIGAVLLVIFIIISFKKSSKTRATDGAIMLIYTMIIAGMVEVTYSWNFFLGIALLVCLKQPESDESTSIEVYV